jgi:hypothetical protein
MSIGEAADSPNPDQALSSVPPYVRRGDEVEARYRAYRERLERFYDRFALLLKKDEPDLYEKLKSAHPKPVVHGYQVLPRIIPDPPKPATPPRAISTSFSWRRTEGFLDVDTARLGALEESLGSLSRMPHAEARASIERMVSEYLVLAGNQKLIDSHIQYNRFWQQEIDRNRAGYEEMTALHDAVLQRQVILDALRAAEEPAFRKAVAGIWWIDPTLLRAELEPALRERERALFARIHEKTDRIAPPAFVRIEHPGPRLWVVRVAVYTDIESDDFLGALQEAVENTWHVVDGEDEFRVALEIRRIPPAQLYAQGEPCQVAGGKECASPGHGEHVDLQKHVALFPSDGAVLTTGASTTHVGPRHSINLGPQDIGPTTLAHEFGHILGFPDGYFRGFHDRGEEGFEVLEIGTDPEDIMSNPGSGRVGRHHFAKLVGLSERLSVP